MKIKFKKIKLSKKLLKYMDEYYEIHCGKDFIGSVKKGDGTKKYVVRVDAGEWYYQPFEKYNEKKFKKFIEECLVYHTNKLTIDLDYWKKVLES